MWRKWTGLILMSIGATRIVNNDFFKRKLWAMTMFASVKCCWFYFEVLFEFCVWSLLTLYDVVISLIYWEGVLGSNDFFEKKFWPMPMSASVKCCCFYFEVPFQFCDWSLLSLYDVIISLIYWEGVLGTNVCK